jgi:peptidoglycan hydrolase-like protein with peptidoglycan-binding domain
MSETADLGATALQAKLYPQKLQSSQVQHLQRALGNQAVSRLLVSKIDAAVQRQGDPFAPFKHPDKGPHDLRLQADFDPAPPDWQKKQHNNVEYYHHPKQGWTRSHPIILSQDLHNYAKNKFRDAIEELQLKLGAAMGGLKSSGVGRVDGRFGPDTEGAVKRFQKKFGLTKTGKADYDTWAKLDQEGSVGVKQGRASYAYEEKLVGGTTGTYGLHASYGWAEKKKAQDDQNEKLEVTVVIKFTNLPGESGTIAGWVKKNWNIFKLSYKKDKDGKQTRTKDTTLDLDFALKSGGGGKGPAVYPDNQVLLWRGNHPNWANRNATWSATDKKQRSDAGNWNLDDPEVETMVGHEFGHLIGLEDEYARSHEDIMRLTGKSPLGTTAKGKLTGAQQTKYSELVSAIEGAKDFPGLEKVNKMVWNWHSATPNQMTFLAQEYKTKTGKNLHDAFKQAVTKVKEKALKEEPDFWSWISGGGDQFRQKQKQLAQKAWKEWGGTFPDGIKRSGWWEFWGSSPREFVSGGLMGDYSLLSTKKAEVRPNAVAHSHTHPLEPRHVRRFSEYVSRYKNEVWQAEYR